MVQLMTYAGEAAPDAPGTRTGGVPLVPAGFTWPTCVECEGNLQFLAQVPAPGDDTTLLAFMCANDPGLCEEWDPYGGNAALLVSGELRPAEVPAEGETALGAVSAVALAEHDGDYESGRQAYLAQQRQRDVLGQLGGEPSWLQGDDTPECDGCESPMTFVAQLEEGHDHRTAANFGGGSAYTFACAPCGKAAFLTQG